MKHVVFLLVVVALLAAAGTAQATSLDGKRYELGAQWMYPVAGVSGQMDFGRAAQLQLGIGLVDIPTVGFRLKYAFVQRRYFDSYLYGMLGVTDGETVFGGGGLGLQWDWRMAEPGLPPVSWSLEAGYNYDSVAIGAGIHYAF